MTDHQLGAALKAQVLNDRQRGLAADGRRLQAVAGDLCGADQAGLLPAVRYLVMSAAFASAAGQAEPLADPRLHSRLMQELQQVFTPAICARMEDVRRGLLSLPSQAAAMPVPPQSPASAPSPAQTAVSLPAVSAAADPPEAAAAGSSSGSGGLVAVLSFLTGGLLVALVGAVVLVHQSRLPPVEVSAPAASLPSPEPELPPSELIPPAEPSLPDAAESTAAWDQAMADQALASLQGLYAALSSKNFSEARQYFGGAAADQFDPAFFEQFERVSVANLQATKGVGSSLNLQGIVTFVYPDGSTQIENRSFTVDTSTSPALITDSEFGGVLKAR